MYSSLAYQYIPMSYTHHYTRTGGINAVVIHYTASIVKEAEQTVRYWENSNPYTSASYIIDVTGRITAVIPEEFRPYTSSSWGLGKKDIDNRAITIECSCNYIPPNINDQAKYTLSDETINACIELLADIGKRYGIDKWIFVDDPTGNSGNIHAHRWYGAMSGSPTPCPGDYLYSKFPMIAVKANALMNKQPDPEPDDGGDKPMTPEERQLLNDTADIVQTYTDRRYETVKDLPKWYRTEIGDLVERGFLKGTNTDADGKPVINLSEDLARVYTVMDRIFNDLEDKIEKLNNK